MLKHGSVTDGLSNRIKETRDCQTMLRIWIFYNCIALGVRACIAVYGVYALFWAPALGVFFILLAWLSSGLQYRGD